MMRLQRVGRKNDPSFRIVVVDKRTGPKSNKNIAILGSYNPKMGVVTIDKTEAAAWLSKGVQPSDTVYNILVAQQVVEGRKKNVLPRKSPIVDEEALKRTEEERVTAEKAVKEAAVTAEEAAKAEAEASSEVTAEETPAETETTKEETA